MSDSVTLPASARALDAREERLRRGALIGRYVVLERIGAGGMGVVYAAFDVKLDRKVAVKLLHGGAATDTRRRLEREAQAMARLSHPNVLPIHDVGVHGEDVFVAVDFVDGETLGRWLEPGRGWRDVVRVFRAAGEGLAAAHAAGLVHRDFKPDNVLLRVDGHVFVTDFGLAREVGLPAEPDAPSSGESPLSESLTVPGAVMGTPAFMSPEQRRGEIVDARSDQYSFAVALNAALGTRAPSWVRRVAQRGLAPAPDNRFPSMTALLAALGADPDRRPWLVAGGLGLAALVVGVVAARAPAAVSPCPGAEPRLAGVWDQAVRADVERAFLATGKPYAADVFARAAGRLDGYATAWGAAHLDACTATHVRHEQSPALLDLRMECLDRRLASLEALTRVFGTADATIVGRAAQAAADLPSLLPCADADGLRAALPPPDDPAVRGQVAALRGRLEAGWALLRSGKLDALSKAVPPLVETALAIPYLPIHVDALELRASLLQQTGEPRQAEAAIKEALGMAAQIGDRARVASLSGDLLWVVGSAQSRHAEALALAPVVDALARQVRDGGWTLFRVRFNVASVRAGAGDYEGALAGFHAAMTFRLPLAGPDDAGVGRCHNQIGGILMAQGRYAEARVHLEQGLAIMEKSVGREHPHYAMLLNGLGNLAVYEHKLDEALARYRAAAAICERALPPGDETTATVLGNVAMVLVDKGELVEAERLHRQLLETRAKALGPEHPRMAQALNNYASLLVAQGRLEEAEATERRAVAIREKALGPSHPELASPLLALASILLERGQPAEALLHAQRARLLREASAAPDSAPVASALALVAECELARGQAASALPLIERAVPLLASDGGAEVPAARARFTLARTLVALGRDRVRALALAHQARDGYAADGPAAARDLAAVDRWLADHR